MLYRKLRFKKFSDGRGDLVPLEFGEGLDIPFDVKRCFFISPTHDEIRARHAHKEVKQVILCIAGSFELTLKDGKGNSNSLLLSEYTEGIFMDKLVLNELKNFSNDCRILVFASGHYDPDEYINDYSEFESFVNKYSCKETL